MAGVTFLPQLSVDYEWGGKNSMKEADFEKGAIMHRNSFCQVNYSKRKRYN